MATKVFSVEQLRLNGQLLSGDNLNRLWFADNQLAAGSTAVPTGFNVYAAGGLTGGGTMDGASVTISANVGNAAQAFGLSVDEGYLKLASDVVKDVHINSAAAISINKLASSGVTVSAGDGLIASDPGDGAGIVNLGQTLTLDLDLKDADPGLDFSLTKLHAKDIKDTHVALLAGIDVTKLSASGVTVSPGVGLEYGDGAGLVNLGETITPNVKAATAGSYGSTINVDSNGVGVKKVPNQLTTGGGDSDGILMSAYDGSSAVTIDVDPLKVVMMTGVQSVAGAKTFEDNVIMKKHLTVEGTVTTVDSTVVNIGDNQIVLNNDATNAGTSTDGGILIKRFTGTTTPANASLLWSHGDSRWKMGVEGSETAVALGRAYDVDLAADITSTVVNITSAGFAAGVIPVITASLKNIVADADLIGCIVTAASATSATITFSAPLPTADYDLQLVASEA